MKSAIPILLCLFVTIKASTHPLDSTDKMYTWQAEDRSTVGMWTSGATAKEVEDADADGGAWLLLKAEAPGEFIEFTLPDVLPGRYTLEIRFKAHVQRGSCRIEVGNADGSDHQVLAETLDMRGDGVLHVTYYGVVDDQHLNMLYQRLEPDWFTKNIGVRGELKKPKQRTLGIKGK